MLLNVWNGLNHWQSAGNFTSLQDAIRNAVTGSNVNDGLRLWFSATANESLNDAESRWLSEQAGVTGGSLQDKWKQFLNANGYATKLAYWNDQ